MKKFLVLALAIVMSASNAMAFDNPFSNLKVYGEGSILGYSYENSPNNFGGTAVYSILGLSFDVYENISAAFSLGYTNLWGDRGYEGRAVGDEPGSVLNELKVAEANITFKELFDVEGLSVKLGRQFYGDKDSTVMYVGVRTNAINVVNNNAIESADGATVYYEKGNIKANAVYAILNNNGNNGKNETMMGADFRYMNIADMFDIQAYLYDTENEATMGTRHYTIFGVKPTFKMEGFKASVEFAKDFDGTEIFSENEFSSNLIKVDASYNIEDIGLTPRASFGVFGGDADVNLKSIQYHGNYVPGLIAGNLLFGYADNQIINIGADYSLNKFTFALDFFNYSSRDGGDNENAAKYGNEIDLVVKYAYVENVEFSLGIGHLFADDDHSDFDSSTLQGGVAFKF